MKRISLVLVLALALTFVFAGAAFANFGPHGGYISDTDSCAGCHRAHTSFSTLTFVPKEAPPGFPVADGPSSLLVGNASSMTEFCNACHGDNAPGASTNVEMGLFDGGPSTASLAATSGVQPYMTASTFEAPLNGGGFIQAADIVDWEADAATAYGAVTSTHDMEATGVLWGSGFSVAGETLDLTCTGCHDPHGSSNYRLLKDSVNGNAVGGYNPDGSPNGMVFSVEDGYGDVAADNGWLKHEAGQIQMQNYVPNYTSGSSQIRAAGFGPGSMSVWCAGCHEDYDDQSTDYDYGTYEGGGLVGNQTRHRHPVDITVAQGDTIIMIEAQADGVMDRKIPLEVNPGVSDTGLGTGTESAARLGQIGCITCHFAHGSNAEMGGWGAAHLVQNDAGTWVPAMDTTPGVDPDKENNFGIPGRTTPVDGTSALLRADNRGVCERCHDK